MLLVPLGLGIWFYFKRTHRAYGAITFSNLDEAEKIGPTLSAMMRPYLPVLKIAALVIFIVALARPQKGQRTEELVTRGIDIILCIDTSESMLAEDFKPLNRLDAAKQAALEFIKGRRYDRIGIVVFAEMAFTQCPLTLDYGAVIDFLEKLHVGMIPAQRTALGTAIITSTNRLRKSTAKGKVIILLTDGRNNTGEIDPLTAARAAEALAIKIYTIGVGKKGPAPFPQHHPIFGKRYRLMEVDLDEGTLKTIANQTDALYFRATSSTMLKMIYKKINELEKTEIKVKEYADYHDLYIFFLVAGLFLLLTEIVLTHTYFRRIP